MKRFSQNYGHSSQYWDWVRNRSTGGLNTSCTREHYYTSLTKELQCIVTKPGMWESLAKQQASGQPVLMDSTHEISPRRLQFSGPPLFQPSRSVAHQSMRRPLSPGFESLSARPSKRRRLALSVSLIHSTEFISPIGKRAHKVSVCFSDL